MFACYRLLFRVLPPASLLTITILAACEDSKLKEMHTDVARTPVPNSKSSTQPPGTAAYTAFTTITEERLGVRVYPGAKPKDGGSWQMTDQLAEGAESLVMATLHSEDTIDKVADFYTRELGISPSQVLRVPTRNGPKISITIQSGERVSTNVLIQRAGDGSGTQIKITRMMGRAAADASGHINH